ncbi:family 4 glycosyltransferase [Phakopsora pachyrhizi]|nr:family 4 glycosyltransferase [Phakopsora pachyrhizi]
MGLLSFLNFSRNDEERGIGPTTLNLLKVLIYLILILVVSIYLNIKLFSLTLRLYGSSSLVSSRNTKNRKKFIRSLLSSRNNQTDEVEDNGYKIIGFFHPYCNAGGGGERVLWTAVSLHQRKDPTQRTICAIYTGDIGVSKLEMVSKVKQRFDIELDPQTLILVPLTCRYLVEASTWPRFTIIGQSIGSILLGYEAFTRLVPDIYIDTMGYAFTFPVFKLLANVPVGAYIHYPTISTNMLERVSKRDSSHNNNSTISNSFILSYLKLFYYMIFAELYSLCLRQADDLMVNSTWTKNHIVRLLQPCYKRHKPQESDNRATSASTIIPQPIEKIDLNLRNRHHQKSSLNSNTADRIVENSIEVKVVYPPCDVMSLIRFPLLPRSSIILSISQFRPEKDQRKQIEAFSDFLKRSLTLEDEKEIKLILAGSCRGKEDEDRVDELKKLAKELGIDSRVEFRVNVDYRELKDLLKSSLVGISTMVDEHFGISIVEFMAAGLIPLVHRSGGPESDIIKSDDYKIEEQTGFHATDYKSYSEKLDQIFNNQCKRSDKNRRKESFKNLNDKFVDHQKEQEQEEDEMEEDDFRLIEMRKRARLDSVERFSVQNFETSWMDWFIKLEKKTETKNK